MRGLSRSDVEILMECTRPYHPDEPIATPGQRVAIAALMGRGLLAEEEVSFMGEREGLEGEWVGVRWNTTELGRVALACQAAVSVRWGR